MGGCSKSLAIYAPCSGVSTSSELTATAASPSKSSDAFDRLSLGKLGAPLSGLRHFGRGAVTGPVFGTDTASAFSLLTLLKGTETGPLCGGAPMQCLGVVCMPATAVSSPPATASLAILLDRKPSSGSVEGKAIHRNYLSVSCSADERNEAAKTSYRRCCALCAVCSVYVLCCVCVVLCALCVCVCV